MGRHEKRSICPASGPFFPCLLFIYLMCVQMAVALLLLLLLLLDS